MRNKTEKPFEKLSVTLEELKEELKDTYLYNYFEKDGFLDLLKYFVYTSPGIGTMQAVKQVAQEIAEILKLEFVDFKGISPEKEEKILQDKTGKYFIFVALTGPHLQKEDLRKLDIKENYYTFLVPSWMEALSIHPGILFIDEITNVTDSDVQALLYRLMDERMLSLDGPRLHDKVLIVATGYTTKESPEAKPLPITLVNKLTIMEVKKPTEQQ